jgi:hypothetical protein
MSFGRIALLIMVLLGATTTAGRADRGPEQCGPVPMRISAMQWTGAKVAGSWFLKVDPSGSGVVSMGDAEKKLQLSGDKCAELAAVAAREGFFDLKGSFGVEAIEGQVRELRLSLGAKAHVVTLYDGIAKEPDRDAVKRALRVWILVRGLFDLPGAEDSRNDDLALLQR